MAFIGINQFGSLTSKIGKIPSFEDFDVNKDGKISNEEFESLFKEEGWDTVEFSTVDKNADKEVSEEEFNTWEQERKMQEAVNNISGQVAKDFIGSNAKYSSQVMSELKDYINEFSTTYKQRGGKISDMAEKFIEALPNKYNEIKASVLAENSTTNESETSLFKDYDDFKASNFHTNMKREESIKFYNESIKLLDKILWGSDASLKDKIKALKEKIICTTALCQAYRTENEKSDYQKAVDNFYNYFSSISNLEEYIGTKTGQKTALEYIKKILQCKEIPDDEKSKWTSLEKAVEERIEENDSGSKSLWI